MLRLHQLKDTDGSGNEDRSVVGNFSVEEVIYKGVPPLVTFTFSFWFIAVVAARGGYFGRFKPCIFIHEFAITLFIIPLLCHFTI